MSFIIDPYKFVTEGLGNGYLYNWYAASDANFAPTDWKVPAGSDYNTLVTFLGGSSVAGGKLKETGFDYWLTPNTGADNTSGFTAYGSGTRLNTGNFIGIKANAFFWRTDTLPSSTWLALTNSIASAGGHNSTAPSGCSIRLIYTGAGTPTTVTDNDGNVYDVVLIGTQRWTVQNWKCTTLDNNDPIPNVTDGTAWSNLTTLGRCAYDNDESNV